LEPGRDIEIVFTGVRPGEKLREELWEQDKVYDSTDHPDIFRSNGEDLIDSAMLHASLTRLSAMVGASQPDDIVTFLDKIVPGSAIRATPPPVDVTDVV
jgi:FlaA1/EpsC-like NDP-sugar epimerase